MLYTDGWCMTRSGSMAGAGVWGGGLAAVVKIASCKRYVWL